MTKRRILVRRTRADLDALRRDGDPTDSYHAAWRAIRAGSAVIRDIQRLSRRGRPASVRAWKGLSQATIHLDPNARAILKVRLDAIHRFKRAPHHADGFRLSVHTGAQRPRPITALCLVSGHEGQEIPGLVAYDRVVVDAEHMEQALGPATVSEIFRIRKSIGEYVYISTNVSETPQIVRLLKSGQVDTRATAALTASKVIAAIDAGVDVVKVGFANLDFSKRDLRSDEVVEQMKLVRGYVDEAVTEKALVMPLNRTGRYPLISVFFPEIGIDANGERPREIGDKAIDLTRKGGWQGVLIDTFEKHTGRRYADFYTLEDTRALARRAHDKHLEFWIAGSIAREEVAALLRCDVDLICFGGAARDRSGRRPNFSEGPSGAGTAPRRPNQEIKRPLVEGLVRVFERVDRRQGSYR